VHTQKRPGGRGAGQGGGGKKKNRILLFSEFSSSRTRKWVAGDWTSIAEERVMALERTLKLIERSRVWILSHNLQN